jgi:uncharacterized protein (UPF0210 family)
MKKIIAEIEALESKVALSDDMIELRTMGDKGNGVQFSLAGGGVVSKKDYAKLEALVKQMNEVTQTKEEKTGSKYVVCMDFATMPFSDSPHESSQLGAHYLTEGAGWSTDSRKALTFESVAEAMKFGKKHIAPEEMKRPGGGKDDRGGSAPKGHGGPYVAIQENAWNVKPVKAIK